MSRIVVVGSGASGVHFALSALEKGHDVLMLDVGFAPPGVVAPQHRFDELKSALADPAEYFLGPNYEAVTRPGSKGEVYAFPPSKGYVFSDVADWQTRSRGIEPLTSFAQGGLAEAWTAGVYPFNEHELADFPFGFTEIGPHYGAVAQRIGVNGAADDLARFFPLHDHLTAPLYLDRHSSALLKSYARHKGHLNQRLGCHLGRSRVATLTHARENRASCSYCGRCLWGCPSGAFYTPSLTLRECLQYPNFRYQSGVYVSHFKFDARRNITALICRAAGGGQPYDLAVDRVVLAAGTLSSARIFLESIYRNTGEILRLTGLMDNRQILVPFINLRLLGAPYEPSSYQYHQIALGLEGKTPREYIHGQITTLTTGLVHPIIDSLPLDLRTGIRLFRHVRAALGVVNINLHDTRRTENYVTLECANGSTQPRLVLQYSPTADEPARINIAVQRVRRALRKLGCLAPRAMVHIRPMGAGVHYAGTLPMSRTARQLTVSAECQSHDFSNLFLADGSTFPFLPAKNLTFTLMANATRLAHTAF
jgi:choline dehydrogenase-like flavoprotein